MSKKVKKKLEEILGTTNLNEFKVEYLFNDYKLENMFGKNFYNKIYLITNKEGKKSLLKIKNNAIDGMLDLSYIEDADLLLPFAERTFSPINRHPYKHILTTSADGTGIFSVSENKFILKEGEIPNIIGAERASLFGKEIFRLTNSSGKKGIYVPSDKKLSIPVQYDEINRQSEMCYCPTPNITNIASSEITEGTFFTRKEGKIGLYSYRKDKHYRPKPDDIYDEIIEYKHISRRKIPNVYDKIEFFSNKGIFKVFIEETPGKYKEGLLNIYLNKIIVPPIFDKIASFNPYDYYDSDYPKNFIGYIGPEEYIINIATSEVYKIIRCEMPFPENYQEIKRQISGKKETKGKSRTLKR